MVMKNKEDKEPVTKNADHFIDITADVCPMTFVKTKLLLEKAGNGEVVEVRLKGSEPLANVPRSAREHGHDIVSMTPESLSSAPHSFGKNTWSMQTSP